MNVQAPVVAFLTCIILASCDFGRTSEFSPKSAARTTLRSFKELAAELDEKTRNNISSIETFYRVTDHIDNASPFPPRGMAWNFRDPGGLNYYSYLVYPKSKLDEKESIFIAAPGALNDMNGRNFRIVLTHSLEILEIGEEEFHTRIVQQLEN